MIFAKCSNSSNDKCYPDQSIILPALHYLFCINYVYFATKKGLLSFIFTFLGFLFVCFFNYYYFCLGLVFCFFTWIIFCWDTGTQIVGSLSFPLPFSPTYFHPCTVWCWREYKMRANSVLCFSHPEHILDHKVKRT